MAGCLKRPRLSRPSLPLDRFTPKKVQPFQLVPVIALAITERER
jgi:hypothetical protein